MGTHSHTHVLLPSCQSIRISWGYCDHPGIIHGWVHTHTYPPVGVSRYSLDTVTMDIHTHAQYPYQSWDSLFLDTVTIPGSSRDAPSLIPRPAHPTFVACLLFVLQATKAGCGGLETRLPIPLSEFEARDSPDTVTIVGAFIEDGYICTYPYFPVRLPLASFPVSPLRVCEIKSWRRPGNEARMILG